MRQPFLLPCSYLVPTLFGISPYIPITRLLPVQRTTHSGPAYSDCRDSGRQDPKKPPLFGPRIKKLYKFVGCALSAVAKVDARRQMSLQLQHSWCNLFYSWETFSDARMGMDRHQSGSLLLQVGEQPRRRKSFTDWFKIE